MPGPRWWGQDLYHPGHPLIIEFLRSILSSVIGFIAKERGIRDHAGRIPFGPERVMVRPANAGDKSGCRQSLGREQGVSTKSSDALPDKLMGPDISNKTDKISCIRVNPCAGVAGEPVSAIKR